MLSNATIQKLILDAQYREDERPQRVYETGEWKPSEFQKSDMPGQPCTPTIDTTPGALLAGSAPKPWSVRVSKRSGKYHIIDDAGREVCTVLTGETDAFLIAAAVNTCGELLDYATASDGIIAAQRARIDELEQRVHL